MLRKGGSMGMHREIRLRKIFLILFIIFSISTSGQIREINVGDFHLVWNERAIINAQHEQEKGYWPQGWYGRSHIAHFYAAGAFENLIGYLNLNDDSEGLDTLAFGVQIYQDPTMKAIRPTEEIRRYKPPSVVVDGVLQPPGIGEVDPNSPCAQHVKSLSAHCWGFNDWGCMGGPWYKVNIYAFENQEYNDFLIFDVWMINALDWDTQDTLPDGPQQTLRFWFGFDLGILPSLVGRQQYGHSWTSDYWADKWNSYIVRQSTLVTPGSTERDSLLISYACDANDPNYGVWDDFGDPDHITGELLSTQYIGFATLHADISSSDRTDDPSQPLNAISAHLAQQIWSNTYEEWGSGYGAAFDWMTNRYRRSSRTGDNPWTPYVGVEDLEFGREMRQMHGPYEVPFRDSIHWVFALGAGSIDPEYALQLGRDWFNGSVSDLEKDSIIATGLDSLFNTLDKAKWAWENFEATGDFGIQTPPPAPDLEVTSGPSCIYVNWGYSTVDYSGSITEWRVYRKEGNYEVAHPDDAGFMNYELIYSTTNAADTSLIDSVPRGVLYHYFVTAIDNNGLESNHYLNRTLDGASAFEPGISRTDSVVIVPNPYYKNAEYLNYSGAPNRINFFNLPPYCTLKIYTEVGDLIKTIEHTNGRGDESWNQTNASNQFVKSGVYILSVQDAKDIDLKSLPTKNYKFIIVR